tara:strand:- start:1065 stop:1874 length:810 start_codon:yes stop_codon:yes gene_type:complete
MAKELPYYKHEPSEWLEGEIQICSDAAIVCFTNLKDGYWLKLGVMSYAFALHKYCRRDKSVLQELISNGIVDLIDDNISISFLDKQLNEFQETSEKRRSAANKRWGNKDTDASALQDICKSNAIREEKIREEKRKEINNKKNPAFNFRKSLIGLGAKEELATEWITVRKNRKATNSKTAFDNFENEVKKSKYNINEILKVCVIKSWSGFKSSWDFEGVIDDKAIENPSNEELITFNSNVNPTVFKLPKSQFLKLQEDNKNGGYKYKIIA